MLKTMIAPIPNPSSYVGLDEEVIFLRFEYLDSNCFEIETFQLILLDAPEVFPTDDLVLCDDVFVMMKLKLLILNNRQSMFWELNLFLTLQ